MYSGRTQTKGTNVTSFIISDTNQAAIPNVFELDVTTGKYVCELTGNFNILTDEKWKTLFPTNFNRYIEPIECGQYIKHGLRPSTSVKIQPSLHIGVCPVPQLTTTNANFVPDKFTDIECQWYVNTDCRIRRVTIMFLDQIRTSVPFQGERGGKIKVKQYCSFINTILFKSINKTSTYELLG